MTCPGFRHNGDFGDTFEVIGILREREVHLFLAARDSKKTKLGYLGGRKKTPTPPETKKTVKSQNFDFASFSSSLLNLRHPHDQSRPFAVLNYHLLTHIINPPGPTRLPWAQCPPNPHFCSIQHSVQPLSSTIGTRIEEAIVVLELGK